MTFQVVQQRSAVRGATESTSRIDLIYCAYNHDSVVLNHPLTLGQCLPGISDIFGIGGCNNKYDCKQQREKDCLHSLQLFSRNVVLVINRRADLFIL